jgi:predicted DNA-binding transcriptional regulator AlpA
MQCDFLDIKTVCQLVGGSRPTHPSTIYRLVRRGAWPKPIHVTPGSSRWLASECEAALAKLTEARQ